MSNKFKNFSEEELISILESGNLSEKEFDDLFLAMEEKGLSGSIMQVDEIDADEGMDLMEYINFHNLVPKDITQKDIKWCEKVLFEKSGLKDKKKAIVILAHAGNISAYRILEKYDKNPDPKLISWTSLAMGECRMFLESEILDKPIIKVEKIQSKKQKSEISRRSKPKK
ncbi:MAG TPA: hypothetical protein DIT25_04555 [Candidatus Moranbacteria bacterium]|nr:hypothetical protein [Candidatus Moranbacteria bacterium]